jgi:uncharacterized protein (DUF362 family)
MNGHGFSRRKFLLRGATLAVAAPFAASLDSLGWLRAAESTGAAMPNRSGATVAIVPCHDYGAAARAALARSFDLLGGIGGLVKNKTVTIKINLTGTNFTPYLGRHVGETYMTHFDTALALTALLFEAGARRVRLVESNQSKAELTTTLGMADWDVKALQALGPMEFENTRNLGSGKRYSHLKVPGSGHLFSSLELNHAYGETDVMISLAKLKNHITAGVTLSLKNMFGLTPNALYGDEAGSEDATAGRLRLHNPTGFAKVALPGLKDGITSTDPTVRVPRIITDICAARPVHLAIIDGITSMSGGEGPWCGDAATIKFTKPGVLIVGLNPVATDAVATAVMGYENPRAPRGTKPFAFCDNHLLLAEEAGIGTADLARIDVRGLTIEKARYPYG